MCQEMESSSSSSPNEDLDDTRQAPSLLKEREFFIDNLLVRIHLIVEMIFSGLALRHCSLDSLSQVAF